MTATYDVVTEFIGDVKQILREDGETDHALYRIAERMHGLIEHADDVPDDHASQGNVHAGGQSKPIYTDETGLTLVRALFPPDHMTPIHNHFCWGVVGVYRGQDRYQEWRRLDGGTGEGEARIQLIEERIIGPGDVEIIPLPPQDIHAQQGHGETTHEFVLFGKNATAMQRLYFDPETNTARLSEVNRV